MKRYPVALCDTGVDDPICPRGSGYYGVVKLTLAEDSPLYRDFNYRTVIPCKEQLLNRYDYEMVEAWPHEVMAVEPVENPGTETIPEEYTRRAGVWRTIEDELAQESDYQAEDFGEDDYDDAVAVDAAMDVDYTEVSSESSAEVSAARSDPRGADTSGP